MPDYIDFYKGQKSPCVLASKLACVLGFQSFPAASLEPAYLFGLDTGWLEGRGRHLAMDSAKWTKERLARPLRAAKGEQS